VKRSTAMILAVAIGCVLPAAFARARSRTSGNGFHYVRPYTTTRGTYVAPHYQTNSNGTRLDNWSTRGNVNPFTGRPGTKNP